MTSLLKELITQSAWYSIGTFGLTIAIGLSCPGCGDSPVATDQDEINRFLDENPDARNPPPETSDLDSNEYEGIVRTPERV